MQNLLLHSKYSHRLHHEIIRNAVAAQEIDLSIGNNKVLNQKELLTLLTTYTTNGFSIWDCLIDSLNDSLIPVRFAKSQEVPVSIHDKFSVHENSYSVENFSYSSRSPFTINSLITCFGADLGLSHLQHYLLNSHWKEAAQMVEKAREIIEEDKGAAANASKFGLVEALVNFQITPYSKLARQIYNESGNELRKLRNKLLPTNPYAETPPIATDFSSLYTSCMKSLATIGYISPGLIASSPISVSSQQAEKSTKYKPYQKDTNSGQIVVSEFLQTTFPSSPKSSDIIKGIKKKTSKPKPLGLNDQSIDVYAAEKLKTAKEQQPEPKPKNFSLRSLYQRYRILPTTPTVTSPKNLGGGGSR